MKTDLQTMIDMLNNKQISFEKETIIFTEHIKMPGDGKLYRDFRMEEVNTKCVELKIYGGYSGFYTSMAFNQEDGSLMSVTAWE